MRVFERLGIRGSVLAPAVATVAAGVVAAGLVLAHAAGLARLADAESRLDGVLPRVKTIARLVADLEAGQRGYVFSGDARLLEPFHAAAHELPRVIGETRAALADDPIALEQLARVEALAVRWIEEAGEPTIAARRRARGPAPDAALADVLGDQASRTLMDQLRAAVAELDRSQQKALADIHRELDTSIERMLVVVPAAAALGSLLVIALAAWVGEGLRRLIEQVAEQGERMADGEVETPVGVADRTEAGRLLRAYATLGLTLKAQTAETQVAQRRAALLAQASQRLGASLDVEPTLDEVAHLAVPTLADWCIVDLLEDDGTIRRVAVAHADPARRTLVPEVLANPPDAAGTHPAAAAIRTGRPQLGAVRFGSPTDAFFATAAHLDVTRRMDPRSYLVVPLVARGRTVGALSFLYADSGRCYEPADIPIAEELARRAAVAIDNARLYREAVVARGEAGRQAELTSAITSNLGEGVVALDTSGRVTLVNRTAAEMLGWSEGELLGQTPERSFHPDHAATEGACRLLDGLEAGRIVRRDEDVLVARGGQRLSVSLTASPIFLQGVFAGSVLVFRDVSERLALETRLREVHKMEAVGQLAGGIAHDFNNILTTILGYAELLGRDARADARLGGGLDEIRKAAERAAGLTRQLLAFGRKQQLAPAVVDLEEALARLRPGLQRVVGEQVTVDLRHAERVGRVKVDPRLLDEALTRLAMNARDAMPGGGRFTVETADAILDRAYAAAHADVRPGAYVRLTVRDTGSGMDETTLAHAFEPFYTTKEVGQGSGLGLAMVHGFVTQSGGHVSVESRLGAGCAFHIYLPRVDEPVEAAPAGTGRAAVVPGATVLLVDDEEALRSIARIVLEDAGYRVLEAETGDRALAAAMLHAGPIDLLLTDVVMPGMNGRQLAERLAALRPGIGVLYMSGYSDDVLGEAGGLGPGSAFLGKPFSPEALLREVSAALDAAARV